MVLNTYIRKESLNSCRQELSIYTKNLEKEQQTKLKGNRRKAIIKVKSRNESTRKMKIQQKVLIKPKSGSLGKLKINGGILYNEIPHSSGKQETRTATTW